MFYFQAKKKKKKRTKIWKKKKICNKAKPTASPTDYKPMDSPKKKKKKKKSNVSVPKGLNQKSLKALSKKEKKKKETTKGLKQT